MALATAIALLFLAGLANVGAQVTEGSSGTTGSNSGSSFQIPQPTCDNILKLLMSFGSCIEANPEPSMSADPARSTIEQFTEAVNQYFKAKCSTQMPARVDCMKANYSSCSATIQNDIAESGKRYMRTLCTDTGEVDPRLTELAKRVAEAMQMKGGTCDLSGAGVISNMMEGCMERTKRAFNNPNFVSLGYKEAMQKLSGAVGSIMKCLGQTLKRMKCDPEVSEGMLRYYLMHVSFFGIEVRQSLLKAPPAANYRALKRASVKAFGLGHIKRNGGEFKKCKLQAGWNILFMVDDLKVEGFAAEAKAGSQSSKLTQVRVTVGDTAVFEADSSSLPTAPKRMPESGDVIQVKKIKDNMIKFNYRAKGVSTIFRKYKDMYPIILLRASEQVLNDTAEGVLVDECLDTVSAGARRRRAVTEAQCSSTCSANQEIQSACTSDCVLLDDISYGSDLAADFNAANSEAEADDEDMSGANYRALSVASVLLVLVTTVGVVM